MMADSFDRAMIVAAPLVAQVDATLVTAGAPADHPVWPLARQVGALPGGAVESIAALRARPLHECAERLREISRGYGDSRVALDALAGDESWEGRPAEASGALARAFAAHLGDGQADDTMTGRIQATASFVDDVADWITDTRRLFAATLAAVLTSAQAVELRTGSGRSLAAADIGGRILRSAADALGAGREVDDQWKGRPGQVGYRPPAEPAPGTLPALRAYL